MGTGFKHGAGGGAPLNFKVVGGTTAPSNPKENTIWVNTSTAITSYIFSATQPTSASGRVWISTGTFSAVEFNALKKNGIQVYPISAKQYISGAWVDKTAKSWQGGAWVEWVAYYFRANGKYVGEWNGYPYKQSGISGNIEALTKVINADGTMTVTLAPSEDCYGCMANPTEIDFSKCNTVYVKARAQDSNMTSVARTVRVIKQLANNYELVANVDIGVGSEFDTYTIDVSGYNGTGYLAFYYYGHNITVGLDVESIWTA